MFKRTATWLLCGLALCAAGQTHAQESARDYVEPRMERPQFETLCQHLNLARDQRNLIDLLFNDYQTAISEAVKEADARALAAGRQKVNDAFSGKIRIDPDELKRLRLEVLKSYQQMFPTVDSALEEFITGIPVLLNAEQQERLPAAVRELNRDIYLHPRQRGSQYEDYAGDGVDVLALVRDARSEGGELHDVPMDVLTSVLDPYELQLDEFLRHTAAAYRQGKLAAKMAVMQDDAAMNSAERQAAIERWKRLYQLNRSTVEAIANMLARGGAEQERLRWLDRFDAACFAWMYPRKRPDRQFEWMNRQKLTPQQLASAQEIYDKYLARRKELNKQAIDIMLRGRLEFQTMVFYMMAAPDRNDSNRRSLYDQLLKNSGEQSTLESSTSAALEGVLDDAMRKAMRDAMKGPDPSNRRTGP